MFSCWEECVETKTGDPLYYLWSREHIYWTIYMCVYRKERTCSLFKENQLAKFSFFLNLFIYTFCRAWIYKQSFSIVLWINLLLRNIQHFLFSSITPATNNCKIHYFVSLFPIQHVVSQLTTPFLMWQINQHKNGFIKMLINC